MRKEEGELTGAVMELEAAARESGNDEVEIGDLIDALDQRGYGPMLAVLPLIELTPLGGIPGFPTLLALTLAIITVRLLMGYEHIWAPGWIRRGKLKSDRVIGSLEWLKPLSLRIDATLHARLSRLAGPTGQRIAAVVILCLLLMVPPLELLPFATTGPMLAIATFGLALLYRDGLLMLLGFAGAAVAVVAALWGAGVPVPLPG